jgi:hypothetical protein
MMKNGYFNPDDIIGSSSSYVADGTLVENTRILLREIEIGGLKLHNVNAVVMHNLDAPLLLGQSAIRKLGNVQIQGDELVIGGSSNGYAGYGDETDKSIGTSNGNTAASGSGIVTVTYFEKEGSSSREIFTLKNNSRLDIYEITIRLFYKRENGELIDYRDLILKEKIPAGLSKKFTVKSFDQDLEFVYKHGGSRYKSLYTLFTVEYLILDSK